MFVSLFFFTTLGLTVLQRLHELRIAKRNMELLSKKGAVEFGAGHYWVLIALHTAFFLSMLLEFVEGSHLLPPFWFFFLCLFLFGQSIRYWVIRVMKDRWTTRVLVVKGETLVSSGPFRYLPHPNYTVVAIELFALPLIFGLVWTALVFTILNTFVLLAVRIPAERQALDWSQT